jgi:hypothetical protein
LSPEVFSGIVGVFMPYAVQALRHFLPDKRWVSYTLSVAVSLVVGGLTTFLSGKFDTTNLLNSAGVALIASQAIYNYWFKPAGQDSSVDKLMQGGN